MILSKYLEDWDFNFQKISNLDSETFNNKLNKLQENILKSQDE